MENIWLVIIKDVIALAILLIVRGKDISNIRRMIKDARADGILTKEEYTAIKKEILELIASSDWSPSRKEKVITTLFRHLDQLFPTPTPKESEHEDEL